MCSLGRMFISLGSHNYEFYVQKSVIKGGWCSLNTHCVWTRYEINSSVLAIAVRGGYHLIPISQMRKQRHCKVQWFFESGEVRIWTQALGLGHLEMNTMHFAQGHSYNHMGIQTQNDTRAGVPSFIPQQTLAMSRTLATQMPQSTHSQREIAWSKSGIQSNNFAL